jgi:hypothetical protein
MDNAIDVLQKSNFMSLLFILCILIFVARVISSQRPEGLEYAARVGYGVFLAYAILALLHFGFGNLTRVGLVLIRALLFAGIAFGAVSCVMPIYLLVRDSYRVGCQKRDRQRADIKRRKEQEEENRLRQERETRDWERRRVQEDADRVRRHEAEAQQRAEQKRREQEKVRIAQACARCELQFNLHKADIQPRFTRRMLDDFMKKYMREGQAAETVEKRADELCSLMERHREILKGRAEPMTLDQLAEWFLDEKKRIEALHLDDELKDDHLAHLNIRYAELSQQILEKLNP